MPTFWKLAGPPMQHNLNASFASLRLSWHPTLSRSGLDPKGLALQFLKSLAQEQMLPGELVDLNLPLR